MLSKSPSNIVFASGVRLSSDQPVKPHLAMDVSDVAKMVQMGKPIKTSVNDNMFYDGDNDKSFDVPLERRRGLDINDVYQMEQDSKKKVSKSKLKFMN